MNGKMFSQVFYFSSWRKVIEKSVINIKNEKKISKLIQPNALANCYQRK